MKSADKQIRRSAQSWVNRVNRRPPLNVYCNSELEDWFQHVILEAEKNKDTEERSAYKPAKGS